MTPTDTIGDDCRLYLGDALAVLPTLAAGSVDAVVTDVPYGTGGHVRVPSEHSKSFSREKRRETWDRWSTDWLADAFRLAPTVATFCPDREIASLLAAAGDRPFRMFVWCKTDPMPLWSGDPGYATEPVLVFGPVQPIGGPNWFEASTPRQGRDHEHVGHPYQKPLRLMRWLVRLCVPPGGKVLDPFMSSGTTIAAAVREQRSAVGIENDPTHYATALRRLRHATGASPDQLFAHTGEG